MYMVMYGKKRNTYVLVAFLEVPVNAIILHLPGAAPDVAVRAVARRQGRGVCRSPARALFLGLAGPSPADGPPGVGPKGLHRVPLRLHLVLSGSLHSTGLAG